jgi:hypothetical protein
MRGVSESTKVLITLVQAILEQDHPQTLRQIHYQLVSLSLDEYHNDKSSYRRLSRILTKARRRYRAWELDYSDACPDDPPQLSIPGDWIVDELRKGERVNVWDNAREYIETVRHSYRRDNWQDQPNYCEIWGEKGTVLGSLRSIANEYGITCRVCRGFGSAGMEDVVGRLFDGINKPITVFYIGDHDASGVLIEPDMQRRCQIASGVSFEMRRLAIHAGDIKTFKLPPQKVKERDTRAKSFRREFGKNAPTVELEALPVAELKQRITDAIADLIDWELWDRQVRVQEVEFASIASFADKMKNLPQIGGEA